MENPVPNSSAVFIEFRQGMLEALKGDEGLEIPLERAANGDLTPASRENVIRRLRDFLKKEVWQPRLRAYCAVGARGVSLRRLNLPPTNKENFERLLALQVESEFPLPPEALAWGYRALRNGEFSTARPGPNQELLVVAVKKEVVTEYSEILTECGAVPVFTIAPLARQRLCHRPPAHSAVLDIGRDYSELVSFENNWPVAARVLSWGEVNLAQPGAPALDAALDALAGMLNRDGNYQKIYLSGRGVRVEGFVSGLERRLKGGAQCEVLEVGSGEGKSAATLGLRSACSAGAEFPLLTLQSKESTGPKTVAQRVPWKWAAVAATLILALLALPYAQAILFKRGLEKRLAAVQAQRGRLVMVDRELEFLRYLKQNQPPYLDVLFLLSKAAVQGTKFDSITMNQKGELALKGSMRDSSQVVALRTKLIESGFFASVAVEEQAPTPDRQKLNVRITAQWKPVQDRHALSVGPTAEDLEKAKNRPKDAGPGAFPPMGGGFVGMPSLPPGVSMPSPMPGAGGSSRRVVMPGRTMPGGPLTPTNP